MKPNLASQLHDRFLAALGSRDLPALSSLLAIPGFVQRYEPCGADGRPDQGMAAEAAGVAWPEDIAANQGLAAKAAGVAWPEGIAAISAAGASLETPDKRGRPPLFVAIAAGSLSCVDALIALGADPASLDLDGNTALHYALMGRSNEIIIRVANLRPWSDSFTAKGHSCMSIAATHDTPSSMEALAALGFETDRAGPSGITPLLAAVTAGSAPCAEWLLGRGADPDAASHDGSTPLKFAILDNDEDLVGRLIAAGADIHSRPKSNASVISTLTAFELAESFADKPAAQAVLRWAEALVLRGELDQAAPPLAIAAPAARKPTSL